MTVDPLLELINVVVTFIGAASAATATLVTPSGAELVPDDITESGGETLVLFTVQQPEAGEWQINVTGNSGPVQLDFQASAGAQWRDFHVVS